MVGLLAFVSTPDRHLGSRLCTWIFFAGMTKCSREFVIKEEIKFVNISKVQKQAPLFSSNFAHGQRCTRKKKLIFRRSMKFPFQRIQDQWIWRPVQRDMAKALDVARSEIRRDRLQRWDKMDITLLFGINFGQMRTCWKEKFVHLKEKFWSNVSA